MGAGLSVPAQRYSRPRSWPVWALPRKLVAYIVAVVAAYLAALGVAAWAAPFHLANLGLFAALLACSAVTVELTRRAGENAGGLIRDVYGVWELPLAIMLPPVYAMLAPAVRIALTQWRIRQLPVHRRLFTVAAIGLSYAAASVFFHALPGVTDPLAASWPRTGAWVLAVAAAGVLMWAVNSVLILPAIKGSDPTASVRAIALNPVSVENDLGELCVAVLVTVGVTVSALSLLFAVPVVTFLQRSFRHRQLVNASRVDSKTGLLNAGTWEREASSEVARAVRTRSPLAVALIDIDHFKLVNDTYGHLAGDAALRAIARTFTMFLREYDLAGRFGGEEFALLLPQTSAVAAYKIAERMREHIAAMPIAATDEPDAEPVRLTVSIGVAVLGRSGAQLTDLLAAADMALYRAKRAGRDQVWIVTDTATVSPQDDGSQLVAPLRAIPYPPDGEDPPDADGRPGGAAA
ncbi:MAG: GGDEF domain-containing protein [Actinobacteria bacterium]|nr:GGDEF domain-containing protein [Actinomycetota bacterium]MBO0785171.1 GGDEF domain-containing protein [Actinomycetota bacterium]MBO0814784.1 GGDEF domain-containing protein [Actinomycetota bacterium]